MAKIGKMNQLFLPVWTYWLHNLMVQFPFMYIMTKQSQRLVEGGKWPKRDWKAQLLNPALDSFVVNMAVGYFCILVLHFCLSYL